MQPNTTHIGLDMFDSRTRNLPCTPDYAIKFAADMLAHELNAIRLWLDAGAFVHDYLKQFYRSNTAQDALNNPWTGDSKVMIGKTIEEKKQNHEKLLEAVRAKQEILAAKVRQKIEEVKALMNRTRPLQYTKRDLYENVLRSLENELIDNHIPLYQLNLYEKYVSQMVYGGNKNESH